ncbi:MAG: sulfotransferase, partial [Actinobacteria bacterium]|nr:sulfotransferase [Actinomycetota bacterium]
MIVTAGQLTHHTRMLPGFLIVGAQRCGTTSLYRALSQHPAVLKA